MLQHIQLNASDWKKTEELYHFATKGEVEKLRLISDFGAPIDDYHFDTIEKVFKTPLFGAVESNADNVVDFLLKKNIKVDKGMKIGHYWGDGDVWMTPLYEAITKKKNKVCKIVVSTWWHLYCNHTRKNPKEN